MLKLNGVEKIVTIVLFVWADQMQLLQSLPVQVNEEHNQVKCHEYQTVSHMNLYHSPVMDFRRIVQANVTPWHFVDLAYLPYDAGKINQ